MMLLEHDAKTVLAEHGVPVPQGFLTSSVSDEPPFDFPWVVKAQVPVGGRGKAGGIVVARNRDEYDKALERLLGSVLLGHRVRHCRIEAAVTGQECYLAIILDASTARVTVLASELGGIDVENHAAEGMRSEKVDYTQPAVLAAIESLAGQFNTPVANAMRDVGKKLCNAFFERELMLAEINPLFVLADGTWVAADAKVVIDDNAIDRQPYLHALLTERSADYEAANVKLTHGFDFVKLDDLGDVGLVTTGAGLSMQLVDELQRQGCRPYNFCDIRTGQFRGQPDRLIDALQWMAQAPSVKVVLMNFFAGVTDLAELAKLMLIALERTPQLRAPVIVRIVGNGIDSAKAIFAAAPVPLTIETDLDIAVSRVVAIARGHSGTSPTTSHTKAVA